MFKTGVITDEISQDMEVAVELCVKHGLDGVEIRSVWGKGPHLLTDAEIDRIKAILDKNKLSTCGISSPFFKCDIDDEKAIAEQFGILDKCIALAKKLGAPYVRGFTFWAKGDFEENLPEIVKQLRRASDVLKGTGIVLVIEMDPSVFAGTAEKIRRVVAAVERDNVKALFDPGNLVWNQDDEKPYPDAYELLKPYIRHVHIKDAALVDGAVDAVAVGTGVVGFDKFLPRLAADGYEGYIVLETHYRKKVKISEELLQLPGGNEFSEGAYPATDESLGLLMNIVRGIKS